MRCFVTGATGFLGRDLVKALVNAKHEVVALAREEGGAAPLRRLGARTAFGDVLARESLAAGMKGAEWVFHFAGTQGYDKDHSLAEQVEVQGARHVGEAAVSEGAMRIVFASTSSIAGDLGGDWFDEATPARPRLGYARAKLEAEDVLRGFADKGLESVHLRIAHVYGIGGFFGQLIGSLNERKLALPRLETWWGWISPEDVAQAALLVAEKGAKGERYLVADAHPALVSDVVEYVARLLSVDLPKLQAPALVRLRVGANRYAFLTESARPRNAKLKALGFNPVQKSYREGIAAFLAGSLLERAKALEFERVPFFKVSEKAPDEVPDMRDHPFAKK